jgi:biopolymer transport protein TolR
LITSNNLNKRKKQKYTQMSEINVTPFVDVMLVLLIVFMVTAPLLTVGIKVDLPKVKATALTDIKDPIEITVKLDGEVYIGESKVEVENLIPRLNAITEQNTEARIYIRGDRVVAYGRIMEIMSIINSAGYIKVALITQNLEQ